MKDKLKKEQKKMDASLMEDLGINKDELKKLKKQLTKASNYPEKGIETWFRVTSKNLYTRRQIVDTKSNILVTINSIIISIILGSLYIQLDEDPHLIWAIVPMILTNVLSIAFAILATRPVIDKGVFNKEDVVKKGARLMTFDDFYKMSESDYEWAIDEMMQDKKFLYGTIKKDIHHLGVDLSQRYKHIRTAYDIFLIGLVTSLIMFGACHAFY